MITRELINDNVKSKEVMEAKKNIKLSDKELEAVAGGLPGSYVWVKCNDCSMHVKVSSPSAAEKKIRKHEEETGHKCKVYYRPVMF